MVTTTRAASICAFAGIVTMSMVSSAEELGEAKRMRWDEPVYCLNDGGGKRIRVQCDAAHKSCLFHDGCAARSGTSPCKELERLKPCDTTAKVRYADLVARGATFQPAIAEAPPGWTRDAQGRVFQTDFDMNRRFWLGGRWEPVYAQHRGELLGRAVIETGLRAEVLSRDTRQRFRFRALTGELALNPLGVRATAFSFDSSTESNTPLLRFTTFWPEARRHDVYLNVGGWVEVMTIDYRPRQLERELHMRFVGAGPTLDLWHSADMASFLRLRGGAAFDDIRQNGEAGHDWLALTPLGAVEADLTLDRAGMHRFAIATQYELPLMWREGRSVPPTVTHRFLNTAAYEPILFAINDQPVSLRLSAAGGYRTDLPRPHHGWEMRGGAGLRVNLWVPAPSAEDRARIRRKRGE